MDTNQLGSLLQQYLGGGQNVPADRVHNDFEQAAQGAPQEHIAAGLSEAFRSSDTPPFPEMLAQLFANSSGTQKENVLRELTGGGGSGLLSGLSSVLGGTQQPSTDSIAQAAREAEQRDPSVVDRISRIYAQHPQLVKSLGATALGIIMGKMAHVQQRAA